MVKVSSDYFSKRARHEREVEKVIAIIEDYREKHKKELGLDVGKIIHLQQRLDDIDLKIHFAQIHIQEAKKNRNKRQFDYFSRQKSQLEKESLDIVSKLGYFANDCLIRLKNIRKLVDNERQKDNELEELSEVA